MEGQRRTCNPIELSKLASRSDKPRCKRGGFFSFFVVYMTHRSAEHFKDNLIRGQWLG